MCLAADILTADGALVLPSGLSLGPGHLELLSNLARLVELQEPVSIVLTEEA
jgi:hypothetical protein